jgi:hypothetical protein
MRRMIAWAGRVTFGAVVALALGFGGLQAFASGRSVETDCQPCYSQEECNDCCIDEMGAQGGYCVIETGACFCIN